MIRLLLRVWFHMLIPRDGKLTEYSSSTVYFFGVGCSVCRRVLQLVRLQLLPSSNTSVSVNTCGVATYVECTGFHPVCTDGIRWET